MVESSTGTVVNHSARTVVTIAIFGSLKKAHSKTTL